ncbi:MAG: TonB-dependent receptor [Lutibacter sp.]|uniref:TonB-dependent receptor plug domain-containing protein n=1 Tax=Lutibacter sp. TaxID=1925666 RepID=UPI0017CB5765|nr:TonB-dependent receptor [Lutibacter sp.]MBT8316063.1 TonB-dependent receptor [Lutibacter sp.]NNJ56922.1 TonB-dependent receptor [Lutibacter sp.]
MKKTVIKVSAFCTLLAVNFMNAQEAKEKIEQLDEVVITDSRFKIKRENSGKVVHKISAETIKNSLGKSVVDLINEIAGIEINGNNGVGGQNLGYFIRGGRSNEVVILIDGIQVIDPLQNSFDLRLLNLDQVASIEIIKGAASTLYGSGAATAVIDIKLKKAAKETINATFSSSVGSNNTAQDSPSNIENFNNAANINGSLNKLNYSVAFGHHYSGGMSAAKPMVGDVDNFEDDPFTRINTRLSIGYQFTNQFSIATFGSFNKLDNSYDGGSYLDAENKAFTKNYSIGIAPKYIYESGSIQLNAAYSLYDIDRKNTQYPGTSEGENYILDAFVKHKFNQKFYGILGVNVQQNEIETYSIPWEETDLTKTMYVEDPKATIVDPYANVVYVSDIGFNLNSGVRLNTHSKYGNHFVFNLNPSYTFNYEGKGYSKIFTSYSSAFVAPSLQELYASWGNVDLKPQESLTFEAGLETKINSHLFNITYFKRNVENIIGYDDTLFVMVNRGDATIDGVEISVDAHVSSSMKISANYTYTNNDNEAIRIPKNKVNINLSYAFKPSTHFMLSYQFNDKRDETDFTSWPSSIVQLDAYSLVNVSANHEIIKDKMTLFASVTNLFNEDFEEILGYNTRGRNYNIGFRLQF